MPPRRRRSPGRFLAPIFLIAVIVATVIIVQDHRKTDSGSATSTTSTVGRDGATTTTASDTGNKKNKKNKKKKTYTVKSGDNLEIVAKNTGLTVDQLQEYNPDLDPQALQVGQKLKLTGSGSSSGSGTDTTTTP
jgi:N-acetylmuramoyl-L-alanine amidase